METLYAKVDVSGNIENVIVADSSIISARPDANLYIQTFADASGDAAKRYNYAVIGGKFDSVNNAFIPPAPYPSWVLSTSFKWQAPTPYPTDGKQYAWDEDTLSWVELVAPSV